MGKYTESTLKEFIEYIFQKTATPGGGSASAYAGAMASSLAGMVINFSLGKSKNKNVENKLKKMLKEIRKITLTLLKLVDKDSKAYERVRKAYKLKKGVQNALKYAAMVPYQILDNARKCLNISYELKKIGNKNLMSDIITSISLAKSSIHGAKANVYINLKYIKDKKFCEMMNKKIKNLTC
jgi:formiminotetrahydrofolate cyclodeaminase